MGLYDLNGAFLSFFCEKHYKHFTPDKCDSDKCDFRLSATLFTVSGRTLVNAALPYLVNSEPSRNQ